MAKLLLLVVSVGALAAIAVGFQQKQLRCETNSYASGIYHFRTMCTKVIGQDVDQWIEKRDKPEQKLEKIEHCTCMLLSMTMVWESMLTHPIEVLYAASREFVDEFDRDVERGYEEELKGTGKKNRLTVRRSNPLFAGDDGDSLYHYYVINYIRSEATSPIDKTKLFNDIMEKTAPIYFDLAHLESSFSKTSEKFDMTHSFTLIISSACNELENSFGPYLDTIVRMKKELKNDMWVYRVVSHDETLFKLVIANMLCEVVMNKFNESKNALRNTFG